MIGMRRLEIDRASNGWIVWEHRADGSNHKTVVFEGDARLAVFLRDMADRVDPQMPAASEPTP